MKKTFILLAFLALVACGPDLRPQLEALEKENKILKEMAGPLPASLDEYYPPKSPAPVYMIEMFSMTGSFLGIAVDLQENDHEGAMANFDAFRSQYEKIRGMVGEWTEKFPLDAVDSLGRALSEGSPEGIGNAMASIGNSCTSCHLLTQVKAQQKYHWPDFEVLTITDPASGSTMPWHDFMMNISVAFTGIGSSLQQGQLENARRSLQTFSDQFSALAQSCYGCHDTPRAYYTDENVIKMISDLGNELALPSSDPDAIQQMVSTIGNEGCIKCHLVHMPSAFAKMNWKNFDENFR